MCKKIPKIKPPSISQEILSKIDATKIIKIKSDKDTFGQVMWKILLVGGILQTWMNINGEWTLNLEKRL